MAASALTTRRSSVARAASAQRPSRNSLHASLMFCAPSNRQCQPAVPVRSHRRDGLSPGDNQDDDVCWEELLMSEPFCQEPPAPSEAEGGTLGASPWQWGMSSSCSGGTTGQNYGLPQQDWSLFRARLMVLEQAGKLFLGQEPPGLHGSLLDVPGSEAQPAPGAQSPPTSSNAHTSTKTALHGPKGHEIQSTGQQQQQQQQQHQRNQHQQHQQQQRSGRPASPSSSSPSTPSPSSPPAQRSTAPSQSSSIWNGARHDDLDTAPGSSEAWDGSHICGPYSPPWSPTTPAGQKACKKKQKRRRRWQKNTADLAASDALPQQPPRAAAESSHVMQQPQAGRISHHGSPPGNGIGISSRTSRAAERKVLLIPGPASWAHMLGRPQPGCLLLSRGGPGMAFFDRTLILITSHDDVTGSAGLVLNRTSPMTVGNLRLATDCPGFLETFGNNRLQIGGPIHMDHTVVLHSYMGLARAHAVTSRLYTGGLPDAVRIVEAGLAKAQEFHMVLGLSGWAPGQLANEVSRGLWHCTSPSFLSSCKTSLEGDTMTKAMPGLSTGDSPWDGIPEDLFLFLRKALSLESAW